MDGRIIDHLSYMLKRRKQRSIESNTSLLETSYGKIRVLDTKEVKPIIINVPDGPNVMEHQFDLIKKLSVRYRVICFEYPGVGMSYPSRKFDYSIKSGTNLLSEVMDILNLEKVSLLFSCSNGYYALNFATIAPDRINRIFICQTPSIPSIFAWTKKSIPDIIEKPFLGQAVNTLMTKKLITNWYKMALPKKREDETFTEIALASIDRGGCFCLASLVQGLKGDAQKQLQITNVPVTMVWGARDFSHRKTDKYSIREHIKDCEVIEFENCGHFPELENTNRMVKLINERLT